MSCESKAHSYLHPYNTSESATLVFHTDFSQQTQMVMFLKNLSIMGGLLIVMAFGTGPYSITEQPEATEKLVAA